MEIHGNLIEIKQQVNSLPFLECRVRLSARERETEKKGSELNISDVCILLNKQQKQNQSINQASKVSLCPKLSQRCIKYTETAHTGSMETAGTNDHRKYDPMQLSFNVLT